MARKTHSLAAEATGPLKGVRILDMTAVVFGAYATQMLGDLGADVIKVEFPGGRRGGGGDIMRWAGHPPKGAPDDLGPIFMTINRNKRSVLLDLREEKAKKALRRLIKTCDVFAASVRYDGLTRLGLDYDAVKAIKPDIVYVHGAGYGSDGMRAGPTAGECVSACVYALMGAVRRIAPEQSHVALHRMSVSYSQTPSRGRVGSISRRLADGRLVDVVAKYARQMGVNPEVVRQAERGDPDHVQLLSAGEMRRWRLASPRL